MGWRSPGWPRLRVVRPQTQLLLRFFVYSMEFHCYSMLSPIRNKLPVKLPDWWWRELNRSLAWLESHNHTSLWYCLDNKLLYEKGMATHSTMLAWRIPWTEEPGELQSMGLQRVRHDWATNTHTMRIKCRKGDKSVYQRKKSPKYLWFSFFLRVNFLICSLDYK